MAPVIVAAEKNSADSIDTQYQTGRVTVITRSQFDTKVATVADVLRNEAGVQVRQISGLGSYAEVSIRGSTSSQVNIYVDGVLVNGAFGGSVDLSQFSLQGVENIEIYRGSTPVQLGAPGIGGSIHIRTQSSANPLGMIKASAGSWETQAFAFSYAAESDIVSDEVLRYAISAETLSSDGDFRTVNQNSTPDDSTDDYSDRRHNNELQQSTLTLTLEKPISSETRLKAVIQHADKEKNLPDRANRPTNNARLETSHTSAQLKFDHDLLSNHSLGLKLYTAVKNEEFSDPQSNIGNGVNDFDSRTTVGGATFYSAQAIGSHVISISVDAKSEVYRDEDLAQNEEVEYSRDQFLIGVQDEWASQDGDWLTNTAIRIFHIADDVDESGSESLNDWYPGFQAGLMWEWSPAWQLRSNISRDVRLPALFELFGDRGFSTGNEELKPETAWNTDLGIAFATNSLRAAATGFYRRLDDAIVTVYSSIGVGEAENVGQAEIYGVELELDYSISALSSVSLKATSQRAEDTSDTTFSGFKLPGIATFESYLSLTRKLGGMRCTLEYVHRSGGFYDRIGNEAIRDLNEFNFLAKWSVNKHSLELSIENLADDPSELYNSFIAPGRRAFISYSRHF